MVADWDTELGFPWKNKELYEKLSPIYALEKVQTPTLILCGENDYRCPLNQSEQMYLRLKRMKKETALIIYPDESHSLSTMDYYKDCLLRSYFWLEKYLEEGEENPLKEGLFTPEAFDF